MGPDRREPLGEPVVDLASRFGAGPLWGVATADLNATLIALSGDQSTPEHVNEERDVLLVVLSGSGGVVLDGYEHAIGSAHAVVIEKGRARRVVAGPEGLRYLSIHRRRAGLRVAPAPTRTRA